MIPLFALLIIDPHEKSVTLHRSEKEAKEEALFFFLDLYSQSQHRTYESIKVESLELEHLAELYDGEVQYEIIQTYYTPESKEKQQP